MSGHLGGQLAALVDGELGHADRERALRHLAHCETCRAEVDAARRFKARLRELAGNGPAPQPELADRLLALGRAAGPIPVPPPLPVPRATTGPRSRTDPGGPGRRRRLPRTAVGGAVLALGLGAVLALGGSPRPSRTPVDPTSDVFLDEHALHAAELPLSDPAVVPADLRR